MAECYLCGRYIQRGEGFRRTVTVGQSSGLSVGRRSMRTYVGVRQGLRTVCSFCASTLDEQQKRAEHISKIVAWVVGGIVLFFFLLIVASLGGRR